MLALVAAKEGTEVVFIGQRLNAPAIEAFLDKALVGTTDQPVQDSMLRPLPHTAAQLTRLFEAAIRRRWHKMVLIFSLFFQKKNKRQQRKKNSTTNRKTGGKKK